MVGTAYQILDASVCLWNVYACWKQKCILTSHANLFLITHI